MCHLCRSSHPVAPSSQHSRRCPNWIPSQQSYRANRAQANNRQQSYRANRAQANNRQQRDREQTSPSQQSNALRRERENLAAAREATVISQRQQLEEEIARQRLLDEKKFSENLLKRNKP